MGFTEVTWWRSFLGELGYDTAAPTPVWGDNAGSVYLAKNNGRDRVETITPEEHDGLRLT